jgi:hypothetical protein
MVLPLYWHIDGYRIVVTSTRNRLGGVMVNLLA